MAPTQAETQLNHPKGKAVPAVVAIEAAKQNAHRAWCAGKPGAAARDRLKTGDLIQIQHDPRFKLTAEAPIFTMGSCFAREIENVLINKKRNILLKGHGIPSKYFQSWNPDNSTFKEQDIYRGALNKYSVGAMAHDIRRVLLNEQYPDDGLIELDQELWFDPHSSGLKLLDRDTALENRQRLNRAMEQVRAAQVIIITLGLTETWRDDLTGLAMNAHPGAQWLTRFSNRFSFSDPDYLESMQAVSGMLELLRERCAEGVRFILTVSPVPLGATFKSQDVIVANTASKSMLRTIAADLFNRYDDVDYFPSFEMVVNSPRGLAWLDDELHVSRPMVDLVVRTFLSAYYDAN